MGVVKNIDIDTFPEQGSNLHKRVEVCFHFNFDHVILGTIVRDDREPPWRDIIQLDDGRYILGTECLYKILD